MSERRILFIAKGSRGNCACSGRIDVTLHRIFTDREGRLDVVSVPLGSVTSLENRQALEQVGHTRRGDHPIQMEELRVCTEHIRVLSCDFNPSRFLKS